MTLTKWGATDAECEKCSNNGGPFKIERKCTDGEYSCKGVELVKTTDKKEDCDNICTESGAGRLNPSVVFTHGIWGHVT